MSRDFTPKEISELMLLSADDALVAINKRMNEPEPVDYKASVYPEYGTEYWVITDRVRSTEWYCTPNDTAYFDSGNYYATQQEAQLESEWRALNTKILNSIATLNKEDNNWVVDWNDLNQKKMFLCWDMETCELKHDYYYRNRLQENNKYYTTNAKKKLLLLYTNEEFKFWITKERGE